MPSEKIYVENFGNKPEAFFWSPGRVNIIGEHSDYHDGYVMPAAIDLGITWAVSKNGDSVRGYSEKFDEIGKFDIGSSERTKDEWMLYLQGVVESLKKRDKKSIALIGFMGTGKTFAGRALAEKKNLVFYDTDEIIEGRAGKSVAEIFAQDGEACFREMEKDVVRGLNFSKPCVVSCGGGLNLDEGNLKRIKDHCNVTWLWSCLLYTSPSPRD